MTARLPSEPVRVTSWLAGWVDYMFAIVLVAGRWLCSPLRRVQQQQAALRPAYAQAGRDSHAPNWRQGAEPPAQSGTLVKAAEIVMLSLAFFLAAHLLAGGTSTAVAPNMNPLGLLPTQAHAAETTPIYSVQHEVTVQADAFATAPEAQVQALATAAPAVTAPTQEAAVLAPAPNEHAEAASLPVAAAEPVPAAVATPAPQPTVAPAAPPPPAPTLAAVAPPPVAAAAGRVLTEDEVRAAALAAGWAPALLDQVVIVAWCESRFNSGAEYLGARGLMQILVNYWFEPFGLDPALWNDPVTNLRAARIAYDANAKWSGDGWAAWTCKP